MSILKVGHHVLLLVSCVGQSSGKAASVWSLLFINPRQESLNDRFLILETTVIYLFERESFFPITPFVFKQFIAIEKTLYGRIGVILFPALRNSLPEISSDVCAFGRLFQCVVLGFVPLA